MKCIKISILIMLVASAIILLASATEDEMPIQKEEEDIGEEKLDVATPDSQELATPESQELATPLRLTSRFLAQQQKSRVQMTCNKYPRVCRVVGSPGPDCCKRKCVNVTKDRLNCGMCGKKCKHSEICCKGKCVNPMSHNRHCGRCNNTCQKGSACVSGLCNYA